MTSIVLGFALGIISAIFFTLYILPQKIVKVEITTFLWTLGLGVLVTALVPYLLAGCPHAMPWADRGIALACGIVWGIGTLAFAAGVARIGLAQAAPIKNTTGVLGTLVGLVILSEWRTTDPWLCLTGSLLIVAAAVVIGQTGASDAPRRAGVAGVLLSLLAAVCYASYLYPLKLVVQRYGYWEFTPWMGAGILLTATVAVLLRRGGVGDLFACPRRNHLLSFLGGVAWTIALFALNASMQLVDLSVAWSLAQLNTIPAVILGIYLFREVHLPTQWPKVLIGLIAATVGTVLLGLAK